MKQFTVIVGNPPYGSGGNKAIRFLNKCLDLCEDVRLVLPLSIRKPSSLNKIRLDAVCVDDMDLPDDTFPGGIRACAQRWVRSDTPRTKIRTHTTHPDFSFIAKGNSPDCMVFRCGASSGKIKLPGEFDDNKPDHYYLRASPEVVTKLQQLSPELVRLSQTTNGMPGLSKHDLITAYMSYETD